MLRQVQIPRRIEVNEKIFELQDVCNTKKINFYYSQKNDNNHTKGTNDKAKQYGYNRDLIKQGGGRPRRIHINDYWNIQNNYPGVYAQIIRVPLEDNRNVDVEVATQEQTTVTTSSLNLPTTQIQKQTIAVTNTMPLHEQDPITNIGEYTLSVEEKNLLTAITYQDRKEQEQTIEGQEQILSDPTLSTEYQFTEQNEQAQEVQQALAGFSKEDKGEKPLQNNYNVPIPITIGFGPIKEGSNPSLKYTLNENTDRYFPEGSKNISKSYYNGQVNEKTQCKYPNLITQNHGGFAYILVDDYIKATEEYPELINEKDKKQPIIKVKGNRYTTKIKNRVPPAYINVGTGVSRQFQYTKNDLEECYEYKNELSQDERTSLNEIKQYSTLFGEKKNIRKIPIDEYFKAVDGKSKYLYPNENERRCFDREKAVTKETLSHTSSLEHRTQEKQTHSSEQLKNIKNMINAAQQYRSTFQKKKNEGSAQNPTPYGPMKKSSNYRVQPYSNASYSSNLNQHSIFSLTAGQSNESNANESVNSNLENSNLDLSQSSKQEELFPEFVQNLSSNDPNGFVFDDENLGEIEEIEGLDFLKYF